MRFLAILFCICLSYSLLAQLAQVNRAIEKVTERDFTKAAELLHKANNKNPQLAATGYAWSVYFHSKGHPAYNLDSAHYFILQAISHLQTHDDKTIDRLQKNGFNEIIFQKQKEKIDSLAFQQTVLLNSIEACDHYLSLYKTSAYVTEVLRLKEILSYERAVQIDNVQGYLAFLEEFPNAPEAPQAKQRYETIRFTEVVSSNALKDLQAFVKENPSSVFVAPVENRILSIVTTGNRVADYLQFLNDVTTDRIRKKAADILFHLLITDTTTRWDQQNWLTDSLISQLNNKELYIMPVYNEQGYNFINELGKTVFQESFTNLHEGYRCNPVDDDVLLLRFPNHDLIATREGAPLFKGSFSTMEDLNYGILHVTQGNRHAAFHKSGISITDFLYDDIQLLEDKFLAARKDTEWSIMNFGGTELYTSKLDSVAGFAASVLLQKNNKWAVVPDTEFRKAAEGKQPTILFLYDEIDFITKDLLWVRSGALEGLINRKSAFEIPLDEHTITPLTAGFLLKKGEKTNYLDNTFNLLLEDCNKVTINKNFLSARKSGRFYLINTVTDQVALYDSVKLWGQHFAFAEAENKKGIVCGRGQFYTLEEPFELKLLGNPLSGAEYIQIRKDKRYTLLHKDGMVSFEGVADEIRLVGADYYLISLNKKVSLYEGGGKKLLSDNYDLISDNVNGTFTLLKDGKLGLFDPSQSLLLEPRFDKKVVKGRKNEWIVFQSREASILTSQGKPVIAETFEDIKEWNDSLYMVQKNGVWSLYHPETGTTKQNGIIKLTEKSVNDPSGLVIFETVTGSGLLHKTEGLLLHPEFDHITLKSPFIIAEKYVKSAEYYFVLYFDLQGNPLWTAGMNREEYEAFMCE